MSLSENAVDFIDDARLSALAQAGPADAARVRYIIAKSLSKQALSVEETAEFLKVSPQTVMRDWKLARAWLLREME